MKKFIVLFLFFCSISVLSGCHTETEKKPSLEALPSDYSVEQAKEDGCVVYENGNISSGQKIWDAFTEKTTLGKEATVRLGFYYSSDGLSSYESPEYEFISDEYPVLFVQDLKFDRETYSIRWYENGAEIKKTYRYMKKYEGAEEVPVGLSGSSVRYVLTNDDTATWSDIVNGMLSSQYGDSIDHYLVYISSSQQP